MRLGYYLIEAVQCDDVVQAAIASDLVDAYEEARAILETPDYGEAIDRVILWWVPSGCRKAMRDAVDGYLSTGLETCFIAVVTHSDFITYLNTI